jgi:CubicO group peptidase (beta-lactamase class C family)
MHLHTIEALLTESVARWNIPGASMAVLVDGEVLEAAAGIANLNSGLRVTPDTLFPYGSITKALTSTLVLRLVQQGLVALDAPVTDYVPEFRPASAELARRITVRHLLAHSSGLPGTIFRDTGWGDDALRANVELINQHPHYFEPGLMFSYCNSGLLLLGRIAETVSGHPWHQVFQSVLAQPLGISTLVTRPEFALRHPFAVGHVRNRQSQQWQVDPHPFAFGSHGPAGSAPAGRARDLLGIVRMYLGEGPNAGFLDQALVREAWSTQSRPPTGLLTRRWGLGWTLYDWAKGVEVVGHNGSTAGTISFLRIHPATKSAVVLLVNSTNGLLLYDEVFREVFRALTGVWEPGVPASAPGFTPDPQRYEGAFEDIHGRIELRAHGEELRVHMVARDGNVGISDKTTSALLHNYTENGFYTEGQVSRYTMNVGKERTRLVERSALCTLENGDRYFHDGYLALKQVR